MYYIHTSPATPPRNSFHPALSEILSTTAEDTGVLFSLCFYNLPPSPLLWLCCSPSTQGLCCSPDICSAHTIISPLYHSKQNRPRFPGDTRYKMPTANPPTSAGGTGRAALTCAGQDARLGPAPRDCSVSWTFQSFSQKPHPTNCTWVRGNRRERTPTRN